MNRKALAYVHCHHKSILGTAAERRILDEMGPSVELPATGCCGMAGAFGYEKGDHYDVAIACGERVPLPAVRHSSNDTVIIAGGFCCREQIESPAPAAALWWGWRGARTHACRLDTHVEAWHFPHRRSHS